MTDNKLLKTLFFCLVITAASVFEHLHSMEPAKEDKNNKSEITKNTEPAVEKKAFDADSPTGLIVNYEREVKNIVEKYKGKDSPEEQKAKNKELIEKVRGFFDLGELARISLGTHWDKRTQKEREEYSDLFQRLIERSYISKSDSMLGDYEVKYTDENIDGKTSKVKSKVIQKDADVDIEYEMHRKGQDWLIFNIIADETNLASNYRTQFNSIIGKYGFSGLISRMKSKLVDEKNGA